MQLTQLAALYSRHSLALMLHYISLLQFVGRRVRAQLSTGEAIPDSCSAGPVGIDVVEMSLVAKEHVPLGRRKNATSIGEHEFVEDGGEGVRQEVGEGCYGCIGSPRGLTAPDSQSGEAAAKITSSVRGKRCGCETPDNTGVCEADDEWHGGRRGKEVGRVETRPDGQSESKVGKKLVSKDIAEVGTRRRIECDDASRSCGRELYKCQFTRRQSSFGLEDDTFPLEIHQQAGDKGA